MHNLTKNGWRNTTRNGIVRDSSISLSHFVKRRRFNPIRKPGFQHSITGFYVQFNIFLKNTLPTHTINLQIFHLGDYLIFGFLQGGSFKGRAYSRGYLKIFLVVGRISVEIFLSTIYNFDVTNTSNRVCYEWNCYIM